MDLEYISLKKSQSKLEKDISSDKLINQYYSRRKSIISKNIWDYWDEIPIEFSEPMIFFALPLSLCYKAYKKESDEIYKILFKDLFKEIEISKKILSFSENWDNEGSKGYEQRTWEKKVRFLTKVFKNFYDKYGLILPTPYINPGMDGDIDIHWKTEKFEIFLSIPENDDERINYYGDNYGDIRTKGTLDIDKLDSFLTWIKLYY